MANRGISLQEAQKVEPSVDELAAGWGNSMYCTHCALESMRFFTKGNYIKDGMICRESFDTILDKSDYSAPENQNSSINLQASDPEADAISFGFAAEDAGDRASFNLTSEGVLTFKSDSIPDFETQNRYDIYLDLSDGETINTSQPVSINITDVAEGPVFENVGSDGRISFNVNENQKSIGTVYATDPNGQTVTYSTETSSINIDSTTGFVEAVTDFDYEEAMGIMVQLPPTAIPEQNNLVL